MPENFSVTRYSGGGMDPDRDEVVIGEDGCVSTSWRSLASGIEKSESHAVLSDAVRSALYDKLRAVRADRIREDDREVFDAQNDGYRLDWNDESVVITGAMVRAEDQSRFREIYSLLGTVCPTDATGVL